MEAPSLKLTYFDCRGRAELTRIIFAYGKIAFEDDRLKRSTFLTMKAAGEVRALNTILRMVSAFIVSCHFHPEHTILILHFRSPSWAKSPSST
jgi:hypothetical protein